MVRKLNTHYYDGQLGPRFKEIRDGKPNPPTFQTAYIEIKSLIKTLLKDDKESHDLAINMLNQLKSGYGRPANYDKSSRIRVDELLPLVWAHVKEYDDSAKRLFLEQLIDIKKGGCPQGRVTRLIQMIEIVRPSSKEKEVNEVDEKKEVNESNPNEIKETNQNIEELEIEENDN